MSSPGSAATAPPPAPPSDGATRRPPAAAERVYQYVKQSVLDRRYEGGTLLTEGELAEAVGVSRTPVREALLRLETEGLLKLYPKKGALVLPVSAQEIADVVETRLLVEEFTVRRATPAPPALLARLDELMAELRAHAALGDLPAMMAADRAFHAEIVRCAGNAILSRLYDQLRDRQLRMGVALLHAHPERLAKTIAEHAEILAAIRSGDPDTAAAAVRAHVGRVGALVRGEESR
ncbi:GntR family transcriptional regulator [Streptomyces sp. BI20]|uniref:GntR family transcriptional regulator n=1 Tax=Streptomyces sp. BI20 TaxID=3403460 RepID=UPI003C74BF7E